MKTKKGYMFILDVAVAIVILIIAATIFFYNFFQSNKTIYVTEQLSHDVVGVLASTKIPDLCSGMGTASCTCPRYSKIQSIVCAGAVKDYNANLLSMTSEIIETGSSDKTALKEMIHEIFVTKNVIDEKRFGFAVIYTDRTSGTPLELYNTETYS